MIAAPDDLVKGELRRIWEIMCACGEWDQYGRGKKRYAVVEFVRSGWKRDRRRGWVCPRCLKQQTVQP